ncbi:hypothetical protein M8C21_006771 [Ambrosia artemisiifolia]|uniref:Uncharacterized protein n=1 Tax=Ambrosia artemisiifolia TaxID=4212 RepID=A0AAD5GUW9_AMBAR|nr:hypothetical protein M8C21_006771 [Ambrosia artemisiifolia]
MVITLVVVVVCMEERRRWLGRNLRLDGGGVLRTQMYCTNSWIFTSFPSRIRQGSKSNKAIYVFHQAPISSQICHSLLCFWKYVSRVHSIKILLYSEVQKIRLEGYPGNIAAMPNRVSHGTDVDLCLGHDSSCYTDLLTLDLHGIVWKFRHIFRVE